MAPSATTTDANRGFVQELFDALNAKDTAFLRTAYADDITFWVAGSLPVLSGRHDRSFLGVLAKRGPKNFPAGVRLTITGITAEGDRVAVEADAHGEHASGKAYRNKFHFLFVVRDRRIVEWKEYMDTMHANDVLISEEDRSTAAQQE